MEPWRPVIIDSLAMSMINGHEIHKEDFYYDPDSGGCYLTKEGLKKYLGKLEKKLQTKTKYLQKISYAVSFRQSIFLQIDSLVHAMNENNADRFQTIEIR